MSDPIANAEMAAAWDGEQGEDWAREWERFDRAVRGHHRRLVAAAAFQPGQRVLDVGCGNGELTRAAATAVATGSALGVDLSSPMLTRARELSQGLANVSFELADAQVHPFAADAHDRVVSRFGAMFFADPAQAFANLRRTTRPGGRLALVAWQPLAENAWQQAIRDALALGRELPSPPAGAPGPFGLADPSAVRELLAGAGWAAVEVEAVREPFWAGTDADDALGFLKGGAIVRGLLNGLDPKDQQRGLAALRATFAEHETPEGVLLGSASWLVTAERPRQ